MKTITYEQLIEKIKKYVFDENDLKRIDDAYQLASLKHEGQLRRSGEPYIIHPIYVTSILADLNSGPNTLVAALLHDTVEDTDLTLEQIKEQFGEEVMILVDGVTKISRLKYDYEITQADNHQKMLLAMSKDIRVILIKIADRLHNMRTIDFQSHDKRTRIANETLDIYAPLAHRLGLFNIKAELEDISLKVLNPPYYYRIVDLVENQIKLRHEAVEHMISLVEDKLTQNDIKSFKINGRTKSTYSIYKKMMFQNRAFEDIYDILALRIIVDKIETCYQVLGIIHANFVPIPKRFKDYIAMPKPNLYQSLHTTILMDDGSIFEFQIRTFEMDRIAEQGVAAHWAYKEGVAYSKEKEQFEIAQKLKWYGELLRMSEDRDLTTNGESTEFVDAVKSDLLLANVYVFTPRGEVIELPRDATPVDFAYRIHSDIGDKTVGANVNSKIVPLYYKLQTGDVVHIRTNKNSVGPSADWLKFVKSNHARHRIRNFLNKANRDRLLASGKELVDKEAQAQKADVTQLSDSFVVKHFKKNKVKNLEGLYIEVGKGILSEKTVVARLLGKETDKETLLRRQLDRAQRVLTTNHETGVVIEGLTTPQIKIANCCLPVHGDTITGFVTKGAGIVVHQVSCPNLNNLDKKRLIDVYWASNVDRKYAARIQIVANNRESILTDIISLINANSITIAEINAVAKPNMESVITLVVLVKSLSEIEKVMLRLMNLSDIYTIERKYV